MGSGGTQIDTQDVLSIDRLNQKMFYIGSSCPVTTYVGMVWQDTSTDPPTLRQRNLNNSGWVTIAPELSQYQSHYTDFLFPAITLPNNIDPWNLAACAAGAGTIAAQAAVANHNGIMRFSSGGTAGYGDYMMTQITAILIQGGEVFEAVFNCNQIATNNIFLGFHNTITATAPTNGCWFGFVAGLVKASCGNGSTTTDPTGYTITAGVWYKARIVVNSNASSVSFYLYTCSNGTLVYSYTITTNIPTAATTGCGVLACNTAASALAVIDMDFMGFYIPLITSSTSGTLGTPPR